VQVGGTSAPAPGFAGALALVLAEIRAAEDPDFQLGSAAAVISHLGTIPGASVPVYDVTQGQQDLFGVGCCEAAIGYDMASGWGSLRFDDYAKVLADLRQ
jgi:hypothetical protein